MNYKYEYGRYKEKCERQEKEITELKQAVEGWKQVVVANNGIVAAIVEATGPVQLKRDRVNELAQEGVPVFCHIDAEAGVYTLTLEQPTEE